MRTVLWYDAKDDVGVLLLLAEERIPRITLQTKRKQDVVVLKLLSRLFLTIFLHSAAVTEFTWLPITHRVIQGRTWRRNNWTSPKSWSKWLIPILNSWNSGEILSRNATLEFTYFTSALDAPSLWIVAVKPKWQACICRRAFREVITK